MNKRKICIITGTRAEYGIMSELIKRLQSDDRVDLQIIATNMHLAPEFGYTIKEIEKDGITIDKKVEMLLSSDTHVGTVKSMGVELIGMADAIAELWPDLIVILGDRYEMLACASAALIFGIPVAHLYGGEITEGAYDDSIRHAITKLSYLHFTSTEDYALNVIQMGESPERVFYVGSLGANNIASGKIMELKELEESIKFKLGQKFILVTYHPVTTEISDAENQINNLLNALETVKEDYKILFTLPNSDTAGRMIAHRIKEWVNMNPEKSILIPSLGRLRYYSALSHCSAVIGNSSSGLCEAPSFKIPTLNIGNRQKGRTQGNTVINCGSTEAQIKSGLKKVLSNEFANQVIKNGKNPYYKPNTLELIIDKLINTPLPENLKKHFYKSKI